MKRLILPLLISVLVLSFLSISSVYAQNEVKKTEGFGGVWIGSTKFTNGEDKGINVGSFFFVEVKPDIYFGYAISGSTEISVENYLDLTSQESYTMTGVAEVIPLEVNIAYVKDIGSFRGWVGCGLSAAFANISVTIDGGYIDPLGDYIVYHGKATGSSEVTYGGQVFAGAEYIFGSVKFIGGNWGMMVQFKYQYLSEVTFKYSGNVEATNLSTGNNTSVSFSDSFKEDLSNTSVVVGLTYHF